MSESSVAQRLYALPAETICCLCREPLLTFGEDGNSLLVEKCANGDKGDLTALYRLAGASERAQCSAVSLCAAQPRKHLVCIEPCALQFVNHSERDCCPVCRGALTAEAKLCWQHCRLRKRVESEAQRLGKIRETLHAKTEEAFERVQSLMQREVDCKTQWSAQAAAKLPRRRGELSSSLSPSLRRTVHTIDVSFDELVDTSGSSGSGAAEASEDSSRCCYSINWRCRNDRSAIATHHTLSGPWPRTLLEDDIGKLAEQLLGLELKSLSSTRSRLPQIRLDMYKRDLLGEIDAATTTVRVPDVDWSEHFEAVPDPIEDDDHGDDGEEDNYGSASTRHN